MRVKRDNEPVNRIDARVDGVPLRDLPHGRNRNTGSVRDIRPPSLAGGESGLKCFEDAMVHAPLESESGLLVNPPPDYFFRHLGLVRKKRLSLVVRDNIAALKGVAGQRAFGEKCGIGEGTVWRVLQGQDGTTIETLRAVAEAHGLEPWQLLVDGFDPANPPALAPLSESERRLYAAIKAALPASQK